MSELQRHGHDNRKKKMGGNKAANKDFKGKGKAKIPPENTKEVGEEGVGVSKIKAALRQTRRLLAKDNLSASVRQEAERKLIALQDEINTKEIQQKERKNALRSHKIRFFERQKLVRRIKKLKKNSSKEGDAEEELMEARVLLNYVLHYPMTQKYVALFPNQGPGQDEEGEGGEKEKETSNSKDQSLKVKERIRQSMKNGDLSNEPEIELESRTKEDQKQAMPLYRKRLKEEEGKSESIEPKKIRKSNLVEDDFFAMGDDE